MGIHKLDADLVDAESSKGPESHISDEVKFRVGGVLKTIKGIGSLLYAPIAVVRGNISNLMKSEVEARTIASHEVGHAIVQLFLGQKPKGIYVIRNKELVDKVGLPAGVTSPDNPIVSSMVLALSGDIAQGLMMTIYGKEGLNFNIDGMRGHARTAFLMEALAGEAAELADKDDIDIDEQLTGPKNRKITSDLGKVMSTLEKSQSLNTDPQKTVAIMVKELAAFLNRPVMKKIRAVITEKVLEKDQLVTFGDSLEKKILGILATEGITKEEYYAEKREMENLVLRLGAKLA